MIHTDAERKQRATVAAKCALAGATFTVTDDDRSSPLFVVTQGAATHLFRKLHEVDQWLDELHDATDRKRDTVDGDGYSHVGMALYSLISEPS